MMKKLLLVLALLALFLCVFRLCRGAVPVLSKVEDIPLPGNPTRFDYQSLDPDSGRLYLSHMGDGEVLVYDTRSEKLTARWPGFPGVTGLLVVPSLGRLYASVTRRHEIDGVDLATGKRLWAVPDVRYPDGLDYDPGSGRVFATDAASHEVVIDASTGKLVKRMDLGGHLGNTRYDPVSRLIYVCDRTRSQLVAIDPGSLKVTARYPLPGGQTPQGLQIDGPKGLAYIGCQKNDRLLVLNLRTRQVEASFPVGGHPDVLDFDPGEGALYVAGEAGVVSLFRQKGKTLEKLGDVPVGSNAHTVSVDPKTHRVYLPLRNVKGRPVLRVMKGTWK